MPGYCNVPDFLSLSNTTPVVDVRSPSEFKTGHIPGAINLPILDDGQREKVGLSYKKEGKYKAVELGFELAGPQLGSIIQRAKKIAKNKKLLLYCWRGGMRSNHMAWLLNTNGIETTVLQGGYKSYRQHGKSLFESAKLTCIVGGFTGSNKTAILHALKKEGEQVLDIEDIANHRGSSFGMIGQQPQVPNEMFENLLIREWISFDQSKRIWIEDESKILGSNHIPEPLFFRIRNSRVFKLEVNKTLRAKNLVEIYGKLDDSALEKAIKRIERKLGGQHMQEALEALKNKNYLLVAEIVLNYYDKTYTYGLSKRDNDTITNISTESADTASIAHTLIQTADKLYKNDLPGL